MQELKRSLAELRRLGLHLDAAEAAEARARRRLRLNTRVYPLYRAVGFQLLIAGVLLHNLGVFGRLGGQGVLIFALVSEVYCVVSWLALRRWFELFGRVGGWDLSDLFFAADLILWAGAIHVTGGPRSLIFFLPLLRVADHRAAANAMAFAHLAPLAYLAVVVAADMAGEVAWSVEATKLALLYLAGVYVAWTGRPAQRIREEREAALAAAAGSLGRLRERTARLDEANRLRGTLLERLGSDLRGSLVRIVGFSRHLLGHESTGEATRGFVRQINEEGERALQQLDDALDPDAPPPRGRIRVSDLLEEAIRREAAEAVEGTDEPAHLVLPHEDTEIHGDRDRFTNLLGHILAAGRHLHGGPPTVELQVASESQAPERIVLRVARRLHDDAARRLFDPFAGDAADDQAERVARLELSMARFLADGLGYRLEAEARAAETWITLLLY